MVEDLRRLGRKRLGSILMADGLVTPEQVTEALEIQKDTGRMLGQVLVALGYITEYDLAKSLATQFQFPYINPSFYAVDRSVVELLPAEMLYKYVFIPMDKFGNQLIVAMAGLLNEDVVQEIKKKTGCDIRVYISTARDVRAVLEKEVPIDAKLRKQIEGPDIAPVVAQVKQKGAAQKPAVKEAKGKAEPVAAAPQAESSGGGLGIFDEADALVTAEKKKRKKTGATRKKVVEEVASDVEPEEVAVDAGAVETSEQDVDWQGLFDEVDKSIREELKKKKTTDDEGQGVDFDFD
jgi:hypothetical protein